MTNRPTTLSQSDRRHLVREAAALLENPGRRLLLRGALSVGTLAMLTGCDIRDGRSAEGALRRVSSFNDRVQAWLFDPQRLAPVYTPDRITRPFPFNAFYPQSQAPVIDGTDYRLKLGGLIADKSVWTLQALGALPQETQITRHVCVEGWSAVGQWSGVRFANFLRRIGADLTAKYVGFQCADGYWTSIDMPTALHPQTQLTLGFGGETLPVRYGFPMKLRIPTKLGFKNPKHITEILVTNQSPGGYWENRGYNWFSGL